MKKPERPPLETLPCPNPDCQAHQQTPSQLTIRKVYGQDQIRYLRCQVCGEEFSERKNTMLYNSKLSETRVVQIAECLSNKNSLKSTMRISGASKSTVKRIRKVIGKKAKALHDKNVRGVKSKVVEFDERHGIALCKRHQIWEGTALDPISKLTIALCLGNRDEYMAQTLMQEVHARVKDKQDLLAISDGFIAYQTHFKETFGKKYPDYSKKSGKKPRKPKTMIRIPRGVAHAVVNKVYKGKRLVSVDSYIAHGTKKCVERGLKRMGDFKINTSAIERSNLTNRSMNAYQVRRSAAFARSLESRFSLAWWVTTVLNFSRTCRSLRQRLETPVGRRLYQERTPAMAAGIADRVWTTLDLLRVVLPLKGG